MFKHANVYVPGAKVRIAPQEGSKLASEGGVGTIENVDPDHDMITVKCADGDSVTIELSRVEPVGE